ncbi:MAG: hypothetical protein KC656_33160, partial [Myxococcales bacterium]|nr:hypothetical protein [Myxococcales bacterium]
GTAADVVVALGATLLVSSVALACGLLSGWLVAFALREPEAARSVSIMALYPLGMVLVGLLGPGRKRVIDRIGRLPLAIGVGVLGLLSLAWVLREPLVPAVGMLGGAALSGTVALHVASRRALSSWDVEVTPGEVEVRARLGPFVRAVHRVPLDALAPVVDGRSVRLTEGVALGMATHVDWERQWVVDLLTGLAARRAGREVDHQTRKALDALLAR